MGQRKIRRIAVTGAAGFIGSHVVEELLRRDDVQFILGLDTFATGAAANLRHINDPRFVLRNLDVREYGDLSLALGRHQIDAVLHLATTPLVYSLRSPREAASAIIDMQFALLEGLREGHFSYLLSFSTSEVYGSSDGLELNEEHRILPRTPYAAAKASADMITLSYCATFGADCTILRPFNNYGPRKRVLAGAGIIPSAIGRIARGLPVHIFGDGSAARDFVFVTDTARAVVKATFNEESRGGIFNLASGTARSVLEIVHDLYRLIDTEPQIEFFAERTADVSCLRGDARKIERVLGVRPMVAWEDGLRSCIEYYSAHEHQVA